MVLEKKHHVYYDSCKADFILIKIDSKIIISLKKSFFVPVWWSINLDEGAAVIGVDYYKWECF